LVCYPRINDNVVLKMIRVVKLIANEFFGGSNPLRDPAHALEVVQLVVRM
jgi:hypothetical protein